MEQEPLKIAVGCPPSAHRFVDDIVGTLTELWGKDPTDRTKLFVGECPMVIHWGEVSEADLSITVGTTGRVGQPYSDDKTRGFTINPHYLELDSQRYAEQVRSVSGVLKKKIRTLAVARRPLPTRATRRRKVYA